MSPAVFWFQSPATWPAVVLLVAAVSLVGLSGLFIIQFRRQVQAAWAEAGRVYQRSTMRLDGVGDLLDGILFEADAAHRLTYTNRAFHALTGYRERDLRSGLTLADLIDPTERQQLLADLDSSGTDQRVQIQSYRLRRRDGSEIPVTMRLSAVLEQDRLVGWRGLLATVETIDAMAEGGEAVRDVEEVLGDILRDFNDTPPEQHEAALTRGLAEIGRQLGVDRCYHYAQSPDGESLVSLRQWYAPGVSPMAGDRRLPGLVHYPYTRSRLAVDGALVLSDVQRLDPELVPERRRWIDQGITSLMLVPLRRDGEIVSVLGCETLGRVRTWRSRDRQLLSTMAEICQRVEGHDLTERRLEQANERTGNLAELLPEPVALTDPDGVVVVWNQALERLSGVAVDAARGRPAVDVIDGFLPGCADWLRLRQDDRESAASGTYDLTRRDGESVWVQLSLRRFRHGAGVDPGNLLHFCDVTASKQAETRMRVRNERLEQEMADQQEELQQAQAQLVEAEKMAAVGRMVTGLAHEINTPVGIGLTAATHLGDRAAQLVRVYGDGVLRRTDFEEFLSAAQESATLIHGNLQRAADLVSNMRQSAVDQTVEQVRSIPLKDYLGDVLLSLGPRLREKHVTMTFQCPDDLVVVADPGTVYRVVSNLVINAVQHAFDGTTEGEIRIRARSVAGRMILTVADNGCGMTSRQQAHMFEPFYTTARGQGGMGLGLHIVYSLVTRNLGGEIRCDSKPGGGTVFRITCPMTKDAGNDDVSESTT